MAVWRQQMQDQMKKSRAEVVKSVSRIAGVMIGITLLVTFICLFVWGYGAAGLICLLGVGVTIVVIRPKGAKVNQYDATLKRYFPD